MPSTTRYKRGDIVLVSFPFTDLSSSKRRPALVISPDSFNEHGQDLVLVIDMRNDAASIGNVMTTAADQILFLTQDDDFLFGEPVTAIVVLSRVRQARPIQDRVEVWREAVQRVAREPRESRLFELLDDGTLLPWQDAPLPDE